MIRKESTFATEIREKMRGGTGCVKIETLWAPGTELKSKTRLCARMTLAPGSSIGYHDHVNEEEVYVIVSGTGIVVEDSQRFPVAAGDTILTGNGAGHSIEATGTAPLVILATIMLY
jgi:mannose-6-phosphate isomerase-like protein (cupin superfamily)